MLCGGDEDCRGCRTFGGFGEYGEKDEGEGFGVIEGAAGTGLVFVFLFYLNFFEKKSEFLYPFLYRFCFIYDFHKRESRKV